MATDEGESAVPLRVPEGVPVPFRVRLARNAASLDAEALAAALGISVRSYHRREAGHLAFRRGELVLIAQICGQDPALFDVLM